MSEFATIVWHSGDEDGFQSQRFGSRDKVRGSIGLGLWIGLGIVIGLGLGVSVLLFLRNTPPLPPLKRKSGKVT